MTAGQSDFGRVIAGHPRGSTLTLSVVPRSSRNQLALDPDGGLRARITAPPVEGAANTALLKLLSDALDLPRSRLTILTGATSRRKTILAENITPVDLAARVRRALDPT